MRIDIKILGQSVFSLEIGEPQATAVEAPASVVGELPVMESDILTIDCKHCGYEFFRFDMNDDPPTQDQVDCAYIEHDCNAKRFSLGDHIGDVLGDVFGDVWGDDDE